MKHAFALFTGIVTGLIIGISGTAYTFAGSHFLASVTSPPPTAASLVHCATQVDTSKWETYNSPDLGYEVRYPSTYELVEEKEQGRVTLRSLQTDADGIHNTIVLEKMDSTLREQMDPIKNQVGWNQAGWKVADRRLFALSTPFLTNDDDIRTLSLIYLFVRGYPGEGQDGTYTMVKATVVMGIHNPELQAARAKGITDFENILTEPEQILSTFRFLQFGELPGGN